jgi:hypothetical protein
MLSWAAQFVLGDYSALDMLNIVNDPLSSRIFSMLGYSALNHAEPAKAP